jgi:hypothetical protein
MVKKTVPTPLKYFQIDVNVLNKIKTGIIYFYLFTANRPLNLIILFRIAGNHNDKRISLPPGILKIFF